MRRFQLFEFCDQGWLPEPIREAILDCLGFIHLVGRPYARCYPFFQKLAEALGTKEVVDLGSGSAVHLEQIIRAARDSGAREFPRLVATDLFPAPEAWAALAGSLGELSFASIPDSVDAFTLDRYPFRAVSICTAFHHFPEDRATAFLKNVTSMKGGVLILELTSRELFQAALVLCLNPLLLAAPFFAKKKTAFKFLIGTFFPIVPLLVAFDGIVSVLRTYRSDEIKRLLPAAAANGYLIEEAHWRYFGLAKGSAVLIYPRS